MLPDYYNQCCFENNSSENNKIINMVNLYYKYNIYCSGKVH